MKCSKKIFSFLLVAILLATSIIPAYAYEPQDAANYPVISIETDVEASAPPHLKDFFAWLKEMRELQLEAEAQQEVQQINLKNREKSKQVEDVILSINDIMRPIYAVPLYNQLDYPNTPYGRYGTVKSHGCGITCLAMAATYLKDEQYLPDQLAKQFGSYNTPRGSYWILFEDSAEGLGLNLQERTNDTDKVLEALANDQIVIALQSTGLFTGGGHFILLVGMTDDGKIMVNDPNGANYTKNKTLMDGFEEGFTPRQVFKDGGPYWIYAKKDIQLTEDILQIN